MGDEPDTGEAAEGRADDPAKRKLPWTTPERPKPIEPTRQDNLGKKRGGG